MVDGSPVYRDKSISDFSIVDRRLAASAESITAASSAVLGYLTCTEIVTGAGVFLPTITSLGFLATAAATVLSDQVRRINRENPPRQRTLRNLVSEATALTAEAKPIIRMQPDGTEGVQRTYHYTDPALDQHVAVTTLDQSANKRNVTINASGTIFSPRFTASILPTGRRSRLRLEVVRSGNDGSMQTPLGRFQRYLHPPKLSR